MHSFIKRTYIFLPALFLCTLQLDAQEKKEIKKYYSSGKLEGTGFLLNGKRTGTWTMYFENGKVSKKINYKNDVEDGLTVSFFADGKINEQIYYANGNVDSLRRYFRTGKLKERTVYSNGRHDRKTTLYDSIGTGKSDYLYRDGRFIKP